MDYQAHYSKLIERAKGRPLEGYSEKHHIVPKCMGGGNNKDNIVRLTPEEHYLAHYLLVKIYPGNHRLLWAAMAMTNHTGKMERSNKLYGWLRRRFGEEISKRNIGQKRSEESKRKMSEAKTGVKRGPHSGETKEKISIASRGKRKSEDHKKSLSEAKIGKIIGPHSDEWKEKQSIGIRAAQNKRNFDVYKTPEYREKQSAQAKLSWAKRREKE